MAISPLDLKPQLLERKQRLEAVIPTLGEPSEAVRLLQEVDGALKRMDAGWYGVCEVCKGEIEKDRLLVDPLVRVCLSCLSQSQQRSLEDDLDLAARIQAALLPQNNLTCCGYDVSYHYESAGPVSGDYCDVVQTGSEQNRLLFILGDVSGKGLSASLLVSHLHAAFHALVGFDFPLEKLVTRANHVLCESVLSTHYATLICGVADARGKLELCNAGHLPAILMHDGEATLLNATGVPLGLFHDSRYLVLDSHLESGDTLLLFSDGISEAQHEGEEFGIERVRRAVRANAPRPARELIDAILNQLSAFLCGSPRMDDLTLMAVHRL
jgi:sigma-B regulation protein RsbU (phosphoserine phosphatase)